MLVLMMTVLTGVSSSMAAGLLIPKDEDIPPLGIKHLRVDCVIDNQTATTRVSQEFQNSTSSDLECTYVFPLPRGAVVRDFAMYINGKRQKGELVEKNRARQVYEQIVRRMKDPGLLEYIDASLLRMRVYPVPASGTQRVEVEYTEVISLDNGMAEYTFPLRTGHKASRTLDDFTVSVRIKSHVPIKSVYSPSHEVGISRPSEHEAVAGMEVDRATLDTDFRLFYTVSDKTFGLNVLTHRPDPERPGTFLILLSPKTKIDREERVARDVAFVFDMSGSMKGQKLKQAKAALHSCVDSIHRDDRFSIITFSTAAESFAEDWTLGTPENRAKAKEWINRSAAAGGTNISEALRKVFALPVEGNRPTTIMFLTDGCPTVDVTDVQQLLGIVKDNNKLSRRVFTFGVGNDVNTHLLDGICEETGGLSEYVRPEEKIDHKVTRLFSKMSHSVMTDLSIDIPGAKVRDIYPKRLPDLFVGSQLVLVGTYESAGTSAIHLKGRIGDEMEEIVYEGNFARERTDRSFITSIYAHRKIGYLLDQIRLHGESNELKDEIIRLSLEHGIQTPYTSYLVLESEDEYKRFDIARRQHAKGGSPGAPAGKELIAKIKSALEPQSWKREESGVFGGDRHSLDFRELEGSGLRSERIGVNAVKIAEQLSVMRDAKSLANVDRYVGVQRKGGRQFFNYRGVWVDERFNGKEILTKIKWGSDAYFHLLREHPEFREILSLGRRVIFVIVEGKAVVIDPAEGRESFTNEEMKDLLAGGKQVIQTPYGA